MYNIKGAAGTRPCLLCKNVALRPPDNDPYLRGVGAPPSQWDLHTDASFFEQVDLLQRLHGQVGRGAFQRLEKAVGVNFDPTRTTRSCLFGSRFANQSLFWWSGPDLLSGHPFGSQFHLAAKLATFCSIHKVPGRIGDLLA